jgi:hypothetical protein
VRVSVIGTICVAAAVTVAACGDDAGRVLQPRPAAAAGEGGTPSQPDPTPASSGEPAAAASAGQGGAGGDGGQQNGPKTLLVVLEGFRPELMSPERTPNLWQLAESGVRFASHHSVLPSNRMAAAASMATGTLPGRHGVLGDRMYLPGVTAHDSLGRVLDTTQPIRIDDQGTLESLQQNVPDGFMRARSLVEVAQAAGVKTAVIGRAGPASLFDLGRQGSVLNDNYVSPRAFAEQVVALGLGVPDDAVTLFPDMTARSAYRSFPEVDLYGPTLQVDKFPGNPFAAVPNTTAYLSPVLPELHTFDDARRLEVAAASQVLASSAAELIVIWLRDAGETALRIGPGAAATQHAVEGLDQALGELREQLPEGSNLLVTSDGGFSALAGEARFFPRWGLGVGGGKDVQLPSRKLGLTTGWVQFDSAGGVPTDGAVRLVDLLNRSGFLAYDGEPCLAGHAYVTYPAWKTVEPEWTAAYPDWNKSCNGGALTGPALVPKTLAKRALIVASNGGSELIYAPSHRKSDMEKLVAFLQGRPEIGAIFLAPRYGHLSGTLSLGLLGFSEHTLLDVLVTYAWDADDPVGYGPFVEPVALEKEKLTAVCDQLPCRPGLFCGTVPESSSKKCRFCPAGVDPKRPECAVAEAQLEAARAASVYQQEGQSCEATAVCAPGLRCTYSRCTQPGVTPRWWVSAPPADFVRGSSYGAMAGVRISGAALVDDYFGVRGGSSPAELSGFLVAVGPAFKRHAVVDVPSGVIDVAPTLLRVLRPGLERKLGNIDGRVLAEALAGPSEEPTSVPLLVEWSTDVSPAEHISFYAPTSAESNSASLLTAEGRYAPRLTGFVASDDDSKTFRYFTHAGAAREGLTCHADTDCPLGVTCGAKGVCLVTPSCVDGVKNGLEIDVDCGSEAKCRLCFAGRSCLKGADCESARCEIPAAPSAPAGAAVSSVGVCQL